MELEDKKAIITGSSRGIGAEIAIQFAKEGASIVLNYSKDKENTLKVKEKIEKNGNECVVVEADVSKKDGAKLLIEESIREYGHIDILVNNAGGAGKIPEGDFTQMPLEYWKDQIDLNLNAAVYCSYYVLKNMLENNIKGKIINISSILGTITFDMERKILPYSIAKAGLNMFTKNLAVEFAHKGITINGIAPGFILTPLNEYRYSAEKIDEYVKRIPRGRFGKTEDIAALAVFLATEKADFITGQTINVDGGQTIDGYIEGLVAN